MEMKKMLAKAMVAAFALPAMAQYNQDITVEGRYVPEFIPRDRIALFPEAVRFGVDNSVLQYSLPGVTVDFLPEAIPIPATPWRATRVPYDARGYVQFGLGSYLQSTLSAGYRIIDDNTSTLGVRLQHNSTSLWKPRITPGSDTRMERYDETLGVYGSKEFTGKGHLSASGQWHIGNFDYYGSTAPSAPTQTLNDASVRLGWTSARRPAIAWNVSAGARYFGYRRFYSPQAGLPFPASQTGTRETHIDLDAAMDFKLSTVSTLSLDLTGDLLLYGNTVSKTGSAPLLASPDNYGMITLAPKYVYLKGGLRFQAGANLDFAVDAGKPGARYNTFHISPDVRLDYESGPLAIFVAVQGGTQLHTLASAWQTDYYQSPLLLSSLPVYTPMEARAGLTAGYFSGFRVGIEGGWRMQKDACPDGFYTLWLNGAASDNLFADTRTDLHGWEAGLTAGYDAGKWFGVEARCFYRPQNGDTGWCDGPERSRWTARIEVKSNPVSPLELRLAYDYRGVRSAGRECLRMPDITNLSFGASWKFTPKVSVWLQADNLLCTKTVYLPGLPEPRLGLTAGAELRF